MKILRAPLLHLCPDPATLQGWRLEYMEDAALLIDAAGIIREKSEALPLLKRLPQIPVIDHRTALVVPGLIDSHIHFPQMDMIGACAPSLLPWLEQFTFPEEKRFRGATAEIEGAAARFASELAAQGTSLAVVYSSSDAAATDCLMAAFAAKGLRGIIGKVSMDQHAPAELLVPRVRDIYENEALIKRWHGHKGRLAVALTPRFAPNCSPALMRDLAALQRSDPSLYMQTHYAENKEEIAWVQQLYPQAQDYLDVYDSLGILGPRTILAHCIHTSAREQALLRSRHCVISHCPTSNLFLGSGLMPLRTYQDQGMALTLGTDVGAGTSFSIWQTMAEAYKVAQLRREAVTPEDLFYAATLGGARALGMPQLGSLDPGFAADLQLLDLSRRPQLQRRWQRSRDVQDKLSALMHGIDDSVQIELWVGGQALRS